MGAAIFIHGEHGKDAKEAFYRAQEKAAYDHGHSGYTGTIAEKDSFVMIPLPAGKKPEEYVNELLDNQDDRIDDKWGPAGCLDLGKSKQVPTDNHYLFFGWASC